VSRNGVMVDMYSGFRYYYPVVTCYTLCFVKINGRVLSRLFVQNRIKLDNIG
jgi:hypothetical protein